MDTKGCVINPLTGRAIKTTGKTYKKLQKKYKDTSKIVPVGMTLPRLPDEYRVIGSGLYSKYKRRKTI